RELDIVGWTPIDEDEDRYPRKLAFAECLCTGCVDVKTGRETTALNSVPIHQTMMVLRRKPCPRPSSPGLITFEVDYIRVPVGCTCVLPHTKREEGVQRAELREHQQHSGAAWLGGAGGVPWDMSSPRDSEITQEMEGGLSTPRGLGASGGLRGAAGK
uniref:Interleukin 17C n=1 Tax=Pavo cristatus TaxID=9049 RepID=A0A8C9FZ38_PAVCR